MPVTEKDVDYIANLAYLSIKPEEKERVVQQMSQIIDYVEQLNQVDTSQIPSTGNVLGLTNVCRPDQVKPSFPPESILANAPQQDSNYFCVPTTVEKKIK
jgi:aspartyl-tRNA(Asn)/glutamyl-tRNA(Gln) amidotransferase subunit C